MPVGDLLVDRKLEIAALFWSFFEVKMREAMRDAFPRAMVVPDMADAERISILVKAATSVGLAALGKILEVDDQRRQDRPPRAQRHEAGRARETLGAVGTQTAA